ncbi:class II fructose-bisphosphate aldolase [Nocardia sp. NPDC023852]|uniref:class II fructose-bisphosphate aldolase n=1 Tax=Nocardia sp. NPDC023852 TaxID=3154697 RepID=UPI0033C9B22A
MKYRNSSSRLISGNPRRRSNSSSANTRVATNPNLQHADQSSSAAKPSTNHPLTQNPLPTRAIHNIRPKFGQCYGDPITRWCHERGVHVEAELGEVGGKEGAHACGVRTDPDEAVEFVTATGVDALAVAVGSSHAMHSRTARLDTDLIARLAAKVPVPLVLHGSSGVPDEGLRAAVDHGMTKINIATRLNVRMTAAIRTTLTADPTLADPRKYLVPARSAIQSEVEHFLHLLT